MTIPSPSEPIPVDPEPAPLDPNDVPGQPPEPVDTTVTPQAAVLVMRSGQAPPPGDGAWSRAISA